MVGQTDWTDEELETAVKGYLWMLEQELSGKDYSKAQVNRDLREQALVSRSHGSLEYRMQNISAALDELCLPRIQGYLPAKNVGNKVKDRIKQMLVRLGHINHTEYAPTADLDELNEKVIRLRKHVVQGTPRGNLYPQSVESISKSFVRDPLVKAFVLNQADGICEGCGQVAPFRTVSGDPYLEVHHVLPLALGGTDTASNAVALCPNCHRRAHFSSDRDDFIASLYKSISRLIQEHANS
jgi:5-methylcytosine-specific restriction protein A